MVNNMKFDDYLQEQLKDPEFKKEWDDIQPEMDVIRAMIDARIEQNLTQKELAARTGIDQADISKLENGTRNPSLKLLKKLAPYCFMDSASSSNASSSNFFLGCSLFGSTFVIFIMIASAACSLFGVGLFFEAAGFVFTLSVIRESKPFPNPFLTAIVTPFLFTNLYDPRFPLQACGNSLPPQICYRTY